MTEITNDLVYLAHNGKGMGIPLHHAGKGAYLAVIDHTHNHIHFLAIVHSLCREYRGRMVELGYDFPGDLLGVVGDDFKANGAAAVLQEALRHGGGGKGIEDAQQHRLYLKIIHEVAGNGNHGIHNEAQAVHTLLRVLAVNNGRHEIRAAGIGAGLHENGIHIAHNNTRSQWPQNAAGSVLGGIGNGGQIHLVQNQQSYGEYHHIDHASDGNGFADLKEDQHRQRNIDQQAHIAYADAADILDDGADAVEPRGGKGIWKNEQFIVQCRQHCHGSNDKIGPDPLQIVHFSACNLFM